MRDVRVGVLDDDAELRVGRRLQLGLTERHVRGLELDDRLGAGDAGVGPATAALLTVRRSDATCRRHCLGERADGAWAGDTWLRFVRGAAASYKYGRECHRWDELVDPHDRVPSLWTSYP